MPWCLEYVGTWFADPGWVSTYGAAKTYATAQLAHDARDTLAATTPGAAAGEIRIREV